jgi:hypothetical protein
MGYFNEIISIALDKAAGEVAMIEFAIAGLGCSILIIRWLLIAPEDTSSASQPLSEKNRWKKLWKLICKEKLRIGFIGLLLVISHFCIYAPYKLYYADQDTIGVFVSESNTLFQVSSTFSNKLSDMSIQYSNVASDELIFRDAEYRSTTNAANVWADCGVQAFKRPDFKTSLHFFEYAFYYDSRRRAFRCRYETLYVYDMFRMNQSKDTNEIILNLDQALRDMVTDIGRKVSDDADDDFNDFAVLNNAVIPDLTMIQSRVPTAEGISIEKMIADVKQYSVISSNNWVRATNHLK